MPRASACDELRNTVIPAGIEATITRDYGETAAEKANKLIQKLAFATASVILLVGLALGRREAVIVGAAVILTLTATLFASWAWGFTLNRVIAVRADLLHRHPGRRRHRGGREHPPPPAARPDAAAASDIIPVAVDEVGGPTILATLTVIAALLPMAFVSGLMGPYMSPIPINSSLGMALSLAIAFTVTPWLALKLMKPHDTLGEHAHGAHAPGRISVAMSRALRRAADAAAGQRAQALAAAGGHPRGADAVGGPGRACSGWC